MACIRSRSFNGPSKQLETTTISFRFSVFMAVYVQLKDLAFLGNPIIWLKILQLLVRLTISYPGAKIISSNLEYNNENATLEEQNQNSFAYCVKFKL